MAVLAKLKGILFGRYVWITNTVSGGVLLSAGDFIQQNIEQNQSTRHGSKPKTYDTDRSGRMMVIGLALGLPHHLWYCFLDRILPGASLLTVGKKILLDQSTFSPFANLTFFMGSGLLEGSTTRQAWSEFRSKFAMVYKIDCCFWPPAQFINFLYLPPVYRVVYVNVVTVAWNVFLSYAKHFDKVIAAETELHRATVLSL